jgi:hypothetical protein
VPPIVADANPSLGDVTPAQWQRLAERRIFFGHQSVGGNILEGVRAVLAANPQIRLRLVQSRGSAVISVPALVEAPVGRNTDPASKAADFVAMLDEGVGGSDGVAMYKFCYVDVNAQTDPAALFRLYRESVERVRARHPELTIVHITMPLMTVERSARQVVRRIIRGASQADVEARRVAYNRLVLETYGGSQPVFDLARFESTRRDGTRSYFLFGGRPIYTLADEWSADGGHLNEAGQRFMGEQFLIFLARL